MVLAIALAISMSGCDSPSGPVSPRSGYRDRLSGVWSVIAPDTVVLGTTFDVQIGTAGSNGCWRKGEDLVSQPGPLQVGIVPFDREYVGTGFCTDMVVYFQHTAPVRASARGTMDIAVAHLLRAVSGADSSGAIHLSVQVR
jgi:hypothetical protein